MSIAESALRRVTDTDALFEFLQDDRDGLGWQFPQYRDIGEVTIDWTNGAITKDIQGSRGLG